MLQQDKTFLRGDTLYTSPSYLLPTFFILFFSALAFCIYRQQLTAIRETIYEREAGYKIAGKTTFERIQRKCNVVHYVLYVYKSRLEIALYPRV